MFRILCLDGGGINGTFSASSLAALDEANQRQPVSERKWSHQATPQTVVTLAESVGKLAPPPRSGERGDKTGLTDDTFQKGSGPLGARI